MISLNCVDEVGASLPCATVMPLKFRPLNKTLYDPVGMAKYAPAS